jgi:hypothetical protein
VIALRPGSGVPPARFQALVGSVLDRDIAAGAPFELRDLATARRPALFEPVEKAS